MKYFSSLLTALAISASASAVEPSAPAQAADDVIEVNCSSYTQEWEDVGWGEWYCTLGNDDYYFAFDIYVDNEASPAGTFTINDLNTWYCAIIDYASGDQFTFKACDATVTETADGYAIDATVTASDDRVFHVVCNPSKPITPTTTVDVAASIANLDLTTGNSSITLTGNNKTFTFNYAGNVGVFDQFNPQSGYTDESGKFNSINHGNLFVSLDDQNDVAVSAKVVCNDSVCYNLLETKAPLGVTGSDTLACHDLDIADFMGARYIFSGTTKDNYQVHGYMNAAPAEGDFSHMMTFKVTTPEGVSTNSLITKSAVLTQDAETGTYVLDGEFIGLDMTDYTVHLDAKPSEVVDTATVDVQASISSFDFTGKKSKIVLTDGSKTFTFDYKGTLGQFTQFGTSTGYSDGNNNFYYVQSGTLNVAVDAEKNLVVSANVLCSDTTIYNILETTKAIEPAGNDTVVCHNLTIPEPMGTTFMLMGSSEDGREVTAYTTVEPAEGDFTDQMTFKVTNAEGKEVRSLFNTSAVISKDKDDNLVLDAEFTGTDLVDYTIRLDLDTLPAPIDTAVVDVEATVTDLAFTRGTSVISLSGDGKTFTFEYDGTFGTFDHFGANSGYTDEQGRFRAIEEGTLTVALDAEKNVVVAANVLCNDTVVYNILETTKAIETVGEQSVVCHNLLIPDPTGTRYTLQGDNEDGYKVTAYTDEEPTEGDLTDKMTFVVTTPDQVEVYSLLTKSAILSKDENGHYVLDAQFVGFDLVGYTIKLDVDSTKDGIGAALAGQSVKNGKFYDNHKLVIRHGNREYNACGQQMK